MQERSGNFSVDDVRYYAPRAPAGSWYPHSFLEPIETNQDGIDIGLVGISRSTARALEDGFDPAAIAVWGFSQGACLLTQHLLSSPNVRYGAAVLFTGGYIGATEPTVQHRHLKDVPVLLRSIQDDPFVPAERVHATARVLTEAGAAVDLRIDPGDQHVVTAEAYGRGSELIAALGAGKPHAD
ncbi:MAG: dienelactone hydrolase family protein [Microbacterium sp.]|nr:dienelactone hydrolase family protein [Microbacterium sp.]MCX6503417.1 dienelactone hydrolase family protein [Microbacterium sp.]